jgi:hypothetical protein
MCRIHDVYSAGLTCKINGRDDTPATSHAPNFQRVHGNFPGRGRRTEHSPESFVAEYPREDAGEVLQRTHYES